VIILTSAISDKAKEGDGRVYKNFSYKNVINETVERASIYGYKPVVYDLGTLGIGEPYYVEDEYFRAKGIYVKEVKKGYKTRALFKPGMVKKCLSEHDDLVAYLDGDALLCDNINEIATDDYDIGVTLRRLEELKNPWHQKHFEIVKYLNAGVIFFNATKAAMDFTDNWGKVTQSVGNDQKALNQLACPDTYPEEYSVHTINKTRIKYFPCKKYNFYYFKMGLEPNIKILHFKGSERHFYPFDWKKRFYCRVLAPKVAIIKKVLRKIK